ncbi:hypothetical protein VKT23_005900 [Stygiomarasmius scandens]|uniref:Uncharacterized protein n=1 Tax=Marasmiellus scandens TaxID=2682957 RepID=A0ABR1JRK7_9AGAR
MNIDPDSEAVVALLCKLSLQPAELTTVKPGMSVSSEAIVAPVTNTTTIPTAGSSSIIEIPSATTAAATQSTSNQVADTPVNKKTTGRRSTKGEIVWNHIKSQNLITKHQPSQTIPAAPKPVDLNIFQFNPVSNDAIVKDIQKHPEEKSAKGEKKKQASNPRQSELSASVNRNSIVQCILNSSGFSVTMGELLACSPDVANNLMDMVKFKNTKSTLLAADAEINWASALATSFLID